MELFWRNWRESRSCLWAARPRRPASMRRLAMSSLIWVRKSWGISGDGARLGFMSEGDIFFLRDPKPVPHKNIEKRRPAQERCGLALARLRRIRPKRAHVRIGLVGFDRGLILECTPSRSKWWPGL